ncbi:peptide ABC transporter substrate-binding protein [Cohnella sp. AR92]|uniref:peptide ABC transporter substrate-binding protein n=1 Tax=Cohnella sp. AR92 TaxID=648716 RepID=UPI000F8F01C7|nr:peptide ABC transporter substrate-binding protein [Cohnella sp. AR92]RUS47642.1 peptide ABC transporter substrate-binding protein [Cohnella sp. AR92]
MKKKGSLSLLALMLVFSVVLAACGNNNDNAANGSSPSASAGASGGAAPSGKPINLYVENEIKNLSQWAASDDISFTVLNNVSEGLYRLDADNNPQPALAQDVAISDDKLTYTFKLRDGIQWSNGTPVTAADFKYAWLGEMNPTTSTNGYSFILTDYIVGGAEYAAGTGTADQVAIEAKDDKTLVVKLKQPTPYFLRLTSLVPYFPLNEAFVTSQGDQYGLAADKLIYAGPYVLKSFDIAAGAVLEKNPTYWDNANVKTDTINLKVIKEQSTALNAYNAGQIDRVTLSSSDVDANKSNPEFGTGIKFRTTYLQFNTKADGLSNVNIRKALSLAFDSNILASTILNNGSAGATGLIPDLMSGDGAKTFRELQGNVIQANVEQAKELWAQGVKELGSAPKLTLLIADTSEVKDVATFLQSEFKNNLGIDVAIDTKTSKARNELMDNNNYQMAVTAWGADYDDAMTYMDLWTNHTPYRGNYDNSQYDTLIANAKKETDDAKRADMLLQAEKLLVETDAVVAPIYFGGYSYLQKSSVTGLIYHPYGNPVEFKSAVAQ